MPSVFFAVGYVGIPRSSEMSPVSKLHSFARLVPPDAPFRADEPIPPGSVFFSGNCLLLLRRMLAMLGNPNSSSSSSNVISSSSSTSSSASHSLLVWGRKDENRLRPGGGEIELGPLGGVLES